MIEYYFFQSLKLKYMRFQLKKFFLLKMYSYLWIITGRVQGLDCNRHGHQCNLNFLAGEYNFLFSLHTMSGNILYSYFLSPKEEPDLRVLNSCSLRLYKPLLQGTHWWTKKSKVTYYDPMWWLQSTPVYIRGCEYSYRFLLLAKKFRGGGGGERKRSFHPRLEDSLLC